MNFANLVAQLNAGTIWPEGIVIITLMVVIVYDLIVGRASSRWTPYIAIAGLLASIVALYYQWDSTNTIKVPDVTLFDVRRDPPALLVPGTRVTLEAR